MIVLELHRKVIKMGVRVAAASSDGKVINQHFGRATQFLIFDIDQKNINFIEIRKNVYACEFGSHDDNKLANTVNLLMDCQIILVSQIGPGAKAAVNTVCIEVYEIGDFIEDAIRKLQKSMFFIKQFFKESEE